MAKDINAWAKQSATITPESIAAYDKKRGAGFQAPKSASAPSKASPLPESGGEALQAITKKQTDKAISVLEKIAQHNIEKITHGREVSDEHYEKLYNEFAHSLKDKMDSDYAEFRYIIEKYLSDLEAGLVKEDTSKLTESELKEFGAVGKKGNLLGSSAAKISSGLRRAKVSKKDLGLTEPLFDDASRGHSSSESQFSKIADKINSFLNIFKEKEEREAGVPLYDDKRFKEDEKYRIALLEYTKELRDNSKKGIVLSVAQSKLLEKMTKDEKLTKFVSDPKSRMTQGQAALFDVGAGALKISKNLLVNAKRALKSDNDMKLTEGDTDVIKGYQTDPLIKNEPIKGSEADPKKKVSIASKLKSGLSKAWSAAENKAMDMMREDKPEPIPSVMRSGRTAKTAAKILTAESATPQATSKEQFDEVAKKKYSFNEGTNRWHDTETKKMVKSSEVSDFVKEEQENEADRDDVVSEDALKVQEESLEVLKEIKESLTNLKAAGDSNESIIPDLDIDLNKGARKPGMATRAASALKSGASTIGKGALNLIKRNPVVSAGLAGAAIGTLAYNNSETVREGAGSVMGGIFGHIPSGDKQYEAYKKTPEYAKQLEDSKKRRADKLASAQTKSEVAEENRSDAKNAAQTAAIVNAPQSSNSTTIVANKGASNGLQNPRNPNTSFTTWRDSRTAYI